MSKYFGLKIKVEVGERVFRLLSCVGLCGSVITALCLSCHNPVYFPELGFCNASGWVLGINMRESRLACETRGVTTEFLWLARVQSGSRSTSVYIGSRQSYSIRPTVNCQQPHARGTIQEIEPFRYLIFSRQACHYNCYGNHLTERFSTGVPSKYNKNQGHPISATNTLQLAKRS